MTTPNNQRVFPQPICDTDPTEYMGGLTLRDLLAGMAMQGQLSAETEDVIWEPAALAHRSYEFANAMLAEKERHDKNQKAD